MSTPTLLQSAPHQVKNSEFDFVTVECLLFNKAFKVLYLLGFCHSKENYKDYQEQKDNGLILDSNLHEGFMLSPEFILTQFNANFPFKSTLEEIIEILETALHNGLLSKSTHPKYPEKIYYS